MSQRLAPVVRHRRPILFGVLVVAVLVALAVLGRDDAPFSGALDPRNPKPSGGQALARVLERHGVDVRVVRSQQALLAQEVDAGTGVVVSNPAALGPSTLDRLRSHTGEAGALVMLGDAGLLGAQLSLRDQTVPTGVQQAGCDEDLARDLVVHTYGRRGLVGNGCFGGGSAHVLVHEDRLWLLASPRSLENGHVLESDNAALGVRLLGQQPRLVWYVADADDLAADEGIGLSRLLPPWLGPGSVLLGLALLALMLWRGRRLGPLVTEPIPVVVRAIESTRSRGRLYRRTSDRGHAATILVDATRRRLTEALGLPARTATEAVADAAAARTGRDPREVRDLLLTTTVPSNSRLADLGRRLVELENEVRRS